MRLRLTTFFFVLIISLLPFASVEMVAQTADVQEDVSPSLVQRVIGWYDAHMNYGSITALMAIESSFIPFPSEVVIPPAAYVASNPENPMNVYLVVFFGTLGALIGALINYFLAMWLGRPIMYKFADSKIGHLCLLNGKKLQRAEDYFNSHGKISTFIGRLIPAIRQLISIPAGLSRMNIGSFVCYTTLGAGCWNIVLALIGCLAHGQADLIEKYNRELSILVVVLVLAVCLWFIAKISIKRIKKRRNI